MRLFATLLMLCLSACASNAVRHCRTLTGPDWKPMASAPRNAESLLALQGLPDEADALWFSRGDDRLVACIYAGGLTSPGCGAAMVYEYAKVQDRWNARGTAMEACEH